jgi:hypothetical protein
MLLSSRPIQFKGRTYVSKPQRSEAKRREQFDHEHNSLATWGSCPSWPATSVLRQFSPA